MEEVDNIILQFLKQLDISLSEDIKTLSDLPVETIIESASKCLTTINPSLKLPPRLPSGISHRIEVAAQIASSCKDLGYKNDVGYQTFLYYNEAELRQVFMFLIEQLPSEGAQDVSAEPPKNNRSLLSQAISRKIAEDLNSIWIPPCCDATKMKTIGDSASAESQDTKALRTRTPYMTEAEIMEALSKVNHNRPSQTTSQPNDVENLNKATKEPEVKKDISKSLKELKETAIVLRQKFNLLESEKNIMDNEFQQANKSLEKAQSELKNVHNILSSIGIDNLSEEGAVDNILDKVQHNIGLLHGKSENHTSKNLELRVEIEKIRNSSSSESERSRCRNTLLSLKDSAKSMKEEYNKKEKLRDQLKKKYEKLKGGNKRSIYMKRILEIIGNVDKQNMEITKVLEDTRQLQKEINSLEGQLERCFSIADETLFGDAKKDDQAKKAYKLLALLHSECNTIVSLVNDTGSLAREIIDLEDNIKAEKTKRTEDTLQRIQQDITRMQEENVR
ncbi:coiled-coil domain-containing protein 22 homolog [Plutella xylostella]|uniref:coiled-coil domain-containing protein 22 homolog n=1 Tax=Plutella xylostella TaxID=51655 RepID=UPI002032F95B|nr:coiled-coil domain-containing protein 22 homolog [Plutella xylostella]